MNVTKRAVVESAEEILGGYFPVLDHGFISLVDYSGGDEMIERAARTSYGPGTRPVNKTRGLIRYLMRHRHYTPFEATEMTFHVSAPIFIARQWFRHRTFSFNEMSGRYSVMPTLFYTPEHEHFALQSTNNKQGREAAVDRYFYEDAIAKWERDRSGVKWTYESLIGDGVARELARIDLPLSTYTQFYFKGNLRNLFNFLSLRCDSHAQYEIRAYANIIAGMVSRVAPLAFEAWLDYDFLGASLSAEDIHAINGLLSDKMGRSLEDVARENGMTEREVTELVNKLIPRNRPNFDLSLDNMLSMAEIEEQQKVAQIN